MTILILFAVEPCFGLWLQFLQVLSVCLGVNCLVFSFAWFSVFLSLLHLKLSALSVKFLPSQSCASGTVLAPLEVTLWANPLLSATAWTFSKFQGNDSLSHFDGTIYWQPGNLHI